MPANEIIGQPAGEVFVHRNVGNLVVGTDLNVMVRALTVHSSNW